MSIDLPRERVAAGTLIFSAGDAGDCAYLIERGTVEVLGTDGLAIARMGEGELFGEIALLDHRPRTASVRALGDCSLVRIERARIDSVLRHADPILRHLLTLLLMRFRDRVGTAEGPSGGSSTSAQDGVVAMRALALTQDMAYAIEHGQMVLHYQPLMALASGQVVGFEALVRWRHPLFGLIMPDDFVGLAERTGVISLLSQWVLQQACRDWVGLRDHCRPAGVITPFVSINLSASDFTDPLLVGHVAQALNDADMKPAELKIELTETAVIEDREAVLAVLRELASRGVNIALDDFGTGYAGLESLRALPISCLKIDKVFVGDADQSSRSHEIVQSAIDLARTLGLTTVAEGVENVSLVEMLRDSGCSMAQGYYFARPMPLAEALDWLQKQHGG